MIFKKIKNTILIFITLFSSSTFYSQVGINIEKPKATLHVSTINSVGISPEGAILPNLTREQLILKDNAYNEDQKGAIIYITDLSGILTNKTTNISSVGYYYFDGSKWKTFSPSIWNKLGTTYPATKNTDDVYIQGRAVIGGAYSAVTGINRKAALTVTGGDASINGVTIGSGPETGYGNIVFGYNNLINNMKGDDNIALGSYSLETNTSGSNNIGIGLFTLNNNTTGSLNTAIGRQSLAYNTIGKNNTAIGCKSLSSNTEGNDNIGIGGGLYDLTTGSRNIGIGHYSLSQNQFGEDNIAIGYGAASNISGSQNTIIGNYAAQGVSGTLNVAIGYNTYQTANLNNTVAIGAHSGNNGNYGIAIGYNSWSAGNYGIAIGYNSLARAENSIAIGYGSSNTIANSIVLGNSSITAIRAQVQSITALSDARVKKNVQNNVPGISFIEKLRPVTYQLDIQAQNTITGNSNASDTEIEKILQSGFIAQEVEKAAKETGYDFNGIYAPKNNKDTYGLTYATFVVPLVKAVQEQQEQLKEQQEQLKEQQDKIEKLEALVKELLDKQK